MADLNLDPAAIEASRARLASMKSFFGGTASTREACALRKPVSLEISAAEKGKAKAALAEQRKPASRAGSGTALHSSQAAASARATAKRRSDFSDLDADDDQPAMAAQGRAALASSALALAAALERGKKPEGSSKPKPAATQGEMRRATPPPLKNTARCCTIAVPPSSSRPVKVVQPKGKAGAAGRSAAVAPQMMGALTERQKADRVMEELRRKGFSGIRNGFSADHSGHSADRGARQDTKQAASASGRAPTSTPPRTAGLNPHDPFRKQVPRQTMAAAARQMPCQHVAATARQMPFRQRRPEEDNDEDLDDFIDDDEGTAEEEDWHKELRAITGGYDPSKFRDHGDDSRMVASRAEIEAEERRSLRAGRTEDQKAADEEARLRALKAAKKEKARKKTKTGAAAFLAD